MQYLNMTCPFCGGHRVAIISKEFDDLFEYDSIVEYKCLDCGNNVEKVDSLYVPCDNAWGVGYAHGALEPQKQTLTITNCEKFKVQLKEIDVEFELEPDTLENIDIIIINGHKYIKDKTEEV